MRKRLFIGASALAMIGVAAYMFLSPRKGTVEYHKARYFHLSRKAFGETRWSGIVRGINRVLGTEFQSRPDPVDVALSMSAEYEALLRLGYLVQKNYCFTNAVLDTEARWISEGVYQAVSQENAQLGGHGLKDGTTNVLVVIAPLEDIPIWERFISQADTADVPENAK